MKLQGTSFDTQYIQLCERVLNEGHRDKDPRPRYSDGSPAHAYSIFNHDITIEKDQVPILFSKKLYFKKAIEEILWIWQQRSHKVSDLQAKNNHIWDEWEQEDGTIGKAYGYQLAKHVDDTNRNQVDNLIYNLKNDPYSRRHIVSLWSTQEGHEMALKPCVYETQWVVINDELNLKVLIRSSDLCLGLPFNISQYWFLHKLICQEVGIEPGKIIFSIAIPHIYDRHINQIESQIDRFKQLNKIDPVDKKIVSIDVDDVSFDNISWDNIRLSGYNQFGNEPLKNYRFEVAI